MADPWSVETLAFGFASRTFPYEGLAQSLSIRFASTFSSSMREHLDRAVKADQCAQYVDSIGSAANNATDLTRDIRAVFKCIRKAGLIETKKMPLWSRKKWISSRDYLTRKNFPPNPQNLKHSQQTQLPENTEKHYNATWIWWIIRNFLSAGRLKSSNRFYKLLKPDRPINLKSELNHKSVSVNRTLSNTFELALKQTLPGEQTVLMTEESFRSAGQTTIVEDNWD